ncbi:MAG: NAD(P)/FAD-dependent oxidoreductase [Proteobacteria bacterium]|nr:NAD(P)/FAD-dependent oxidoreductase [Pseudomonadota bacterium]
MEGQDRQAAGAAPLNAGNGFAAAPIETDVLIVGAGPVGLFQVFELGLQELHAEVVDSLPMVGGQAAELYPDKPLYDIPGIQRCSGRELVDRLMRQIAPFKPGFHLDQEVDALQRLDDGRHALATSAGQRFIARAVVVASGVGSFRPRRLKIDGLARHVGGQLWHRVDDARPLAGEHVVVVGDEELALDTAARLASTDRDRPASVTLMHRRDQFRAEPSTVQRVQALRASGALRFIAGQAMSIAEHEGRLVALNVACGDGRDERVPVDRLLVLLGLSPKLGPVADWGLALERKQVVVDAATFETNASGVFAVGDIVSYPGKRRLILSGFHEAALASFGIAARLAPGRAHPLEYTTTSPRLHRLLGVGGTPPDQG